MTIRELVERLQEFDQDLEVVVGDENGAVYDIADFFEDTDNVVIDVQEI